MDLGHLTPWIGHSTVVVGVVRVLRISSWLGVMRQTVAEG